MFRRDHDEIEFHKQGSVSQAIDAQRRLMKNEIDHLTEQQLKSVPLDQIAKNMADRFCINIPTLEENEIRPDRREVDIDVSNDPMRFAHQLGRREILKGTEISISVPFKGNRDVFRLHAGNHTMEYPMGQIGASSIIFRRRGINLEPNQVRHEFDEWLAAIKRHLAGMTAEIGAFNIQVQGEALAQLTARANKLSRDDDLLNGLGFGRRGAGS